MKSLWVPPTVTISNGPNRPEHQTRVTRFITQWGLTLVNH